MSNALDGIRFNAFSLTGTNDWEDCASSSMSAMALETLTDMEERVDRLEGLLTEIRDLLAQKND